MTWGMQVHAELSPEERVAWGLAVRRLIGTGAIHLEETCASCPTQYDVTMPDGRLLYFRYRFSRWQLHHNGPSWEPVVEGVLEDRPGGEYDGSLEPGEVRALLELAIPELLHREEPVRDLLPS